MSRNEPQERRDLLDELTVRDFGIIEEITWRPAPGLNVITGETGAGKSIVVDAVEALLLGQAGRTISATARRAPALKLFSASPATRPGRRYVDCWRRKDWPAAKTASCLPAIFPATAALRRG